MKNLKFTNNGDVSLGYVYIIECEGHYKIGKTLTYTTRFYEYTKLFSEPKIVFCELVRDYDKVETELHDIFLEKHTRGEWYDLDERDLKIAKRFINNNKADLMPFNIDYETLDNEKSQKIGKFKDVSVNRISGRFIKTMPKEQQIVYLLASNPSIYLALNVMKFYLQPNSNVLLKNGKKYGSMRLAEDMNVTRQTSGVYIRKLKELNIIAEVDMGRKGKYLAINPYIYLAGDYVPTEIVRLFKNKGN